MDIMSVEEDSIEEEINKIDDDIPPLLNLKN